MSNGIPDSAPVGVVGAGAMGAGIAQIAAAAGHPVWLLDTRAGAAESAIGSITRMLGKLVDKNKLSVAARDRALAGLRPAASADDLKDCGLVVEAIVENLDAKRGLFAELESIVADDAILATNTSSISVTAIGAALRRPERLVGMHFFNPAPLMPLVEVVSGLATDTAVAESVFATADRWGKRPVHARSTPGFIVNRVARPFYAEALRVLQEAAADVATLDAVMRDAGGFRMGPCELMDMIGHDVNYAVTRSVFDAFYGDPRFQPSLIQLELVDGGRFGRKSGQGFYCYADDAEKPSPRTVSNAEPPGVIRVDRRTAVGAALFERLSAAGIVCQALDANGDDRVAEVDGAVLSVSDGRTATQRAAQTGLRDLVVMDLMRDPATARRVAIARAARCDDAAVAAVAGMLQAAGIDVAEVGDTPGLIVMRTVAMLANEAFEAVHQNVCSLEAVDLAMVNGVGYPEGPVGWARRIGLASVVDALDHLSQHYGDGRYRASPLLRREVLAGAGSDD